MRSMWKDSGLRIAGGRIVGITTCVAGFVVIGLGWSGMARVACPDCQLPYLLSGGAAGIALVIFGIGLLLLAELRAVRDRLSEHLERLTGTAPSADGAGIAEDVVAHANGQQDGTKTEGHEVGQRAQTAQPPR